MRHSIKGILIFIFMISVLFGQTYLINEGFESGMPTGWTGTASIGTTPYTGSGSLDFNLNQYIITTQVTDPDMIGFYYRQDASPSVGVLAIYYDISPDGNFTNQIGSSISISGTGWSLASLATGLNSGDYYFKIILISAQNKSRTIYIDDLFVTQSIVASKTSLSSFIAEPDASSAEQSFTVSGADLTANITITPPTNYEISTGTGAGFSPTNPITLTQSGGTVNSTTIFVRLKSGLSAGSYNDENITISSTGKISKTVACSGDVRQSINPSTASLSNFNYDPGNGPSSEQNFTVSGQDLTANIVLNAPTNYEISATSGSGFGSSVTLTQEGGIVAPTTIYVRLKAGLSQGSYNAENITISSTGKVSRTVTCNGFVGPLILNVKVLLEGGF